MTERPVPNFAWRDEHRGRTGHDMRLIDREHAYPLEPLISLRNPLTRAGRLWAWLRATPGWAWAPCPLCGLYSGGREWDTEGSHVASVPTPERGVAHAICPPCTRAGRGWDNRRDLTGKMPQ